MSDSHNETTALMDYVCPKSHYLESWGDANPYSSVYCIQQPTINPLFDSRQVEQNLLNWIEGVMLLIMIFKIFL